MESRFEAERQPTAMDHFQEMMREVLTTTSRSRKQRRLAEVKAILHAERVLAAPEHDRLAVSSTLKILGTENPTLAMVAYRVFVKAAEDARPLRQMLGLPPHGRPFPQVPPSAT